MGWKGKDSFEGDESEFIDAAEFLIKENGAKEYVDLLEKIRFNTITDLNWQFIIYPNSARHIISKKFAEQEKKLLASIKEIQEELIRFRITDEESKSLLEEEKRIFNAEKQAFESIKKNIIN